MMWTEVKERAKRAGNGPHHPSFIHQPSVTSWLRVVVRSSPLPLRSAGDRREHVRSGRGTVTARETVRR